jgi:antitoxin PrlF
MGKVTRKGQVTIPKPIREELGIEPGDEVDVKQTADGILIRKDVDRSRIERWQGVIETDETIEERMADLRGRDRNAKRN